MTIIASGTVDRMERRCDSLLRRALSAARWSVMSRTTMAKPRTVPSRRSEEHTSELQSLMRISYAVFCLKKKNNNKKIQTTNKHSDTYNAHLSRYTPTPKHIRKT